MANKNRRILIIASLEISREPAMALSKKLTENGYAPVLCHVGGDEYKIKEDRILENKTSLTDIAGLMILDDGGNPEEATRLAKEAAKLDLVIGLYQTGCTIGKDAKLFKDKYLCSGLPKAFYKGSKPTDAACVRSGNLITCSGGALEAFVNLIVGALGGKHKTIITSSPECDEVTKASVSIFDNLSILFDIGTNFSPDRVDELSANGSRHLLVSANGYKKVLGKGSYCIVLGRNSHSIIQKDQLGNFLQGFRVSKYNKEAEDPSLEILVSLQKTDCGWQAKGIEGFSSGYPVKKLSLCSSLPEDTEEFLKKCSDMTQEACLLVESGLREPENFRYFQASFVPVDDEPKLVHISSSILSAVAQIQAENENLRKEKLLKKKLLEREMALENLFVQPDGSVAVVLGDETQRLDAAEAANFLVKLAVKANEEVIRLGKSMAYPHRSPEYGRLGRLAAMLRHKVRLLMTYLALSKPTKLAEVDIEGVEGWYSNLDLPTKERVYKFDEIEEDLWNSDRWIKNQPRYHPESYEMGSPRSTSGFYYIWWEIANEPYYWSRILEDGIYPMVMQYKGIGKS